jgi:hypothetical protein
MILPLSAMFSAAVWEANFGLAIFGLLLGIILCLPHLYFGARSFIVTTISWLIALLLAYISIIRSDDRVVFPSIGWDLMAYCTFITYTSLLVLSTAFGLLSRLIAATRGHPGP